MSCKLPAFHGSTKERIALLSMGSINMDQGTPIGCTPLMLAAMEGHSRVAKILLNRGANVSIAAVDGGGTALHFSSQYGHLAVTVDLVKAGADVEARATDGATSLHLAAKAGHSEVMAALIEAGANVDSARDLRNSGTPLCFAAVMGCLDAVKVLLRAKASPLLAMTSPPGRTLLPLDMAAHSGHSKVVRELVQQVGVEGCGGASGCIDALQAAAMNQHVDIMAMLMDAGVVDTVQALLSAAGGGREASVKFLFQRQQLQGSPAGVVGSINSSDALGMTPLFRSIDVFTNQEDVPYLISPKVVRLLIDAGADTSSAVRLTHTPGGEVIFDDIPLAFTNDCLRHKKVGVGRIKYATEEQMHRLKAVRRLLLRVDFGTKGSPRSHVVVASSSFRLLVVAQESPPGQRCCRSFKQDRQEGSNKWHAVEVDAAGLEAPKTRRPCGTPVQVFELSLNRSGWHGVSRGVLDAILLAD